MVTNLADPDLAIAVPIRGPPSPPGPTGAPMVCAVRCTRVPSPMRRFGPGPTHSFRYKVAMPLLDLAEVDDVMGLHPAWSTRRGSPVRFRRQDFLGDPATPLDRAVRDLVGERTGRSARGAGRHVGQPAYLGMAVQPHQPVLLCRHRGAAPASGDRSAPCWSRWRTRPGTTATPTWWAPPGTHRFAKELHVSPFLPMGLDYELRYTAPGEHLIVRLDVLQRRPASVRRHLVASPPCTRPRWHSGEFSGTTRPLLTASPPASTPMPPACG